MAEEAVREHYSEGEGETSCRCTRRQHKNYPLKLCNCISHCSTPPTTLSFPPYPPPPTALQTFEKLQLILVVNRVVKNSKILNTTVCVDHEPSCCSKLCECIHPPGIPSVVVLHRT